MESLAIKYISRWKNKGGEQDIQKAIHCLQLLMELERRTGVLKAAKKKAVAAAKKPARGPKAKPAVKKPAKKKSW